MWTNVQFNGSLAPSETRRWFTFGWITVVNRTANPLTFEGRYAVLN